MPVVNENDTVAVEELKLGDNDNLAAIVAALVDADLLLIASDVDGLYSAHPRLDPAARPVGRVAAVTPEVLAMAGGAGSALGTGGMRTKLEAATKAAKAGIATALFNGTDAAAVAGLADGRLRGTLVEAPASRLAARKYWLRHAPGSGGRLRVDAGAARAVLDGALAAARRHRRRRRRVRSRRSRRGAGGRRGRRARRRAGCASTPPAKCAGWPAGTREIEAILGFSYGDTVIRRDDLVAFEEANA